MFGEVALDPEQAVQYRYSARARTDKVVVVKLTEEAMLRGLLQQFHTDVGNMEDSDAFSLMVSLASYVHFCVCVICVCECQCVRACKRACGQACVYVCVVCVHLLECVRVSVSVCVCVCIYVYVHACACSVLMRVCVRMFRGWVDVWVSVYLKRTKALIHP